MEKIREVINKRIQEKKKNEFTDLAPIDDIENGAEYLKGITLGDKEKRKLKILHWQVHMVRARVVSLIHI